MLNTYFRVSKSAHCWPGYKENHRAKLTCQIYPLWPSDATWRLRSESTLAQVMACCLTAPNHYLNQCWLAISMIPWHSYEGSFTIDTLAIDLRIQLENNSFALNLPGANELSATALHCVYHNLNSCHDGLAVGCREVDGPWLQRALTTGWTFLNGWWPQWGQPRFLVTPAWGTLPLRGVHDLLGESVLPWMRSAPLERHPGRTRSVPRRDPVVAP